MDCRNGGTRSYHSTAAHRYSYRALGSQSILTCLAGLTTAVVRARAVSNARVYARVRALRARGQRVRLPGYGSAHTELYL
eukprot:2103006-Pleurochrysis_carterae.AAC.1